MEKFVVAWKPLTVFHTQSSFIPVNVKLSVIKSSA